MNHTFATAVLGKGKLPSFIMFIDPDALSYHCYQGKTNVYSILMPHFQSSKIPVRLQPPLWCRARQIQVMDHFKIKYDSFITSQSKRYLSYVEIFNSAFIPSKNELPFGNMNKNIYGVVSIRISMLT